MSAARERAPITAVCAALGDDSRWEILRLLSGSPRSASELAELLPITRQAIARHLGVLEEVALVTPLRAGRQIRYRAEGGELSRLATRLERAASGWDARLDALAALTEQRHQAGGTADS